MCGAWHWVTCRSGILPLWGLLAGSTAHLMCHVAQSLVMCHRDRWLWFETSRGSELCCLVLLASQKLVRTGLEGPVGDPVSS